LNEQPKLQKPLAGELLLGTQGKVARPIDVGHLPEVQRIPSA
jgi:hypothetical protein